MRDVIRSIFIVVLLGVFTIVAAELSSEIMADKYQFQVKQLLAQKNYGNALYMMNKIIALKKERNYPLSNEFYFEYARIAFSAGLIQTTIDMVNKYLATAGKNGGSYKKALALLVKAEMMFPGPKMVVIPTGRFRMGCVLGGACDDDEKPVQEVKVGSFALSKYEVTFEEYDRFTDATGRQRVSDDKDWGRERRPVINVSWDDAVAYTQWLSFKTGKGYRLPSEAEWEYAARAGMETVYSWGDKIGHNRANCNSCGSQWGGKETAPVGSFSANSWGLHDMHGNVREWVQDCWKDNYKEPPVDGYARESKDCGQHVVRGGSWSSNQSDLRSANRDTLNSVKRDSLTGFRVVRVYQNR